MPKGLTPDAENWTWKHYLIWMDCVYCALDLILFVIYVVLKFSMFSISPAILHGIFNVCLIAQFILTAFLPLIGFLIVSKSHFSEVPKRYGFFREGV